MEECIVQVGSVPVAKFANLVRILCVIGVLVVSGIFEWPALLYGAGALLLGLGLKEWLFPLSSRPTERLMAFTSLTIGSMLCVLGWIQAQEPDRPVVEILVGAAILLLFIGLLQVVEAVAQLQQRNCRLAAQLEEKSDRLREVNELLDQERERVYEVDELLTQERKRVHDLETAIAHAESRRHPGWRPLIPSG